MDPAWSALVAAGVLLAAQIAAPDVFRGLPDESGALLLTSTAEELGPDGRPVSGMTVSARRGPIVAGFFDVTVSVRSARADLLGIELLVADDRDSDRRLSDEEWTLVGSAPAGPAGDGGTFAWYTASAVPATHDGYRVAHRWTWGSSFDELVDTDLD